MKIQCLDNKGSIPNTFLCKINQHTILINCPLETLTISPPTQENEEQVDDERHDLLSILSTFSEQGKRTVDTQYSSLTTSIQNCDHRSVFRIADFSLIDIDSIDLVLVSNYNLMLGLPYLTEYLGYKGRIIATEPTVEFAKQRMEELVFYHGQTTSMIDPTSSTHFSQLFGGKISEGWRSMYTLKDIESCIEKVQSIRYTEKVSVFSTLNLVAYSSGYCLGSSNWLLETSFKKIAFLTPSSLYTNLHPAPFDYDILKGADVVVVGGLSQQTEKDLSFERARTKLLVQIARTIHSQHNIVLVSASMGLIFDLIGDIDSYFKSLGKEIGHERHQTQIYVANPIADQSLKYANICGEWMNSGRHDLLYVPEMPLAHGNLMRSGGVETIRFLEAVSLSGKKIREPSIVFTGDPSCPSTGSLAWFLKHWGQSDLNTCVFIDPESQYDDVPSHGCKMNFIRLPLDTKLKLEDIPSLLNTYWNNDDDDDEDSLGSEKHLLIPNIKGAKLVKEGQCQQVHIYEPGEVLSINLNRDWERVSVSEKLAKTIEPTMVPTVNTNKGITMSAWAPIHGSLNYYNNHLQIQPTTYVRDDQSLVLDRQSELRINTELNSTIKRFEEHSIPIQITKDINGITTIELPPDMNARVIMNGQRTTVVASDDKVRALLRKITVTDIREL